MPISSLLIFLIPTYLIRFSILGIPTTFYEISLYVAFIYLIYKRSQIIKIPKLMILGIILLLLGAIGGIISAHFSIVSLGQLKGFFVDPVILFVIILWDFSQLKISKNDFIISQFMAFSLSAFFVCAISIVGFLSDTLIAQDGRALGIYAFDTSASPNYLALFLVPIIPILIYSLLSEEYKKNISKKWFIFEMKHLFLFMTVLAVITMLSTRSRAGMGIGFLAIMSVIIFYLRQDKFFSLKTSKVMLYLLWITALVGLVYFSKPNLSPEVKTGRLATSNNIRFEIWKTTLQDIIPKDPLFGIGLGNFQEKFTSVTIGRPNFSEFIAPLALTPHNVFLSLYVNLGILGLIAVVLIIVSIVKLSKRINLQNGVIITSLGVIFIHGLVDTTIIKNDLGAVFFALLALLVIGNSSNSKKEV